ncbi:beta-propeller domain-containing protein [Persicimonas caeni]|nr:beta-propeller domain-containing protein [Persicimonas caeni]
MNTRKTVVLIAATLMAWSLGACSPSDGDPGAAEHKDRYVGQTDFVSADGRNGDQTQDNTEGEDDGNFDGDTAAPGADEGGGRTVEEGDIYQVMASHDYVLNLNSYRGLQIIDFGDPSNPSIIGRVRVTGHPVEMYQVGDRVYVLMNNWRGYYGTRDDLLPTQYQGGMVMAVDVSDPQNPSVTGQAQVPGNIRTSRLTRGNNQEALFVVADDYNNGSETYVKSFTVSTQGQLTAKSELRFGGHIGDIQATPERLMVARNDYQSSTGYETQVSLIDISNPTGEMVEGDSVQVKGIVRNQFNMHIQGDVMRIVSAGSWAGSDTNHLETFDVSDIQNITPIDHDTFGDNQDLFATLFLEDRAFFVTYFRQDPFHAFSIDANGQAEEKSEFIVSGWNDYFQAVASNTRLIGIGKNDENGSTMAVSLYDITDLTNPHPLIERKEVDLDWSWSEANWDHRAYSVLEKGTRVTAPTGETETGLVLLPFSGWDDDEDRYVSAVQIFTFSNNTLTLRGTMDHGSRVRRSFVADRAAHTTANLSEQELSLFNTSDPDSPQELGRVELAPNYNGFWIFGNHGVRRQSSRNYYYYYSNDAGETDTLEVVGLAGDPDTAQSLAEVEIPSNAQVYKVDDLLVTATLHQIDNASSNQRRYETEINVWDFSTPTAPTFRGSLTTDQIQSSYYRDYGYAEDCYDCGYWYGSVDGRVVDDGLVFVSAETERERVGTMHYRYIHPDNDDRYNACWDNGERQACTYLVGGISCRQTERLDGTMEPEVCEGTIRECTRDENGQTDCVDIDASTIETEERTHSYDQYRYWRHYDLQALDLRNPAQPTLGASVEMPDSEDDVNLLARGNDIYITHRESTRVPNDNRPYVRYFFKKIDFSSLSNPQVAAPVNIPGQLIEVDGDTIITRDSLWGENIVETSINKLVVHNGLAYLKGTKRYRDREVNQVALDGAGHVLVSHRLGWRVAYDEHGSSYYEEADRSNYLSVLDMQTNSLPELADFEVDRWANLQDARAGRALFSIPGGLLVVNLNNPAAPYAQAYFPTRGWPRDITVHNGDVYFAGGYYGMYKFGLNETNLSAQ